MTKAAVEAAIGLRATIEMNTILLTAVLGLVLSIVEAWTGIAGRKTGRDG